MPPKRKKVEDDDEDYIEEYDQSDTFDGTGGKRRNSTKQQKTNMGTKRNSYAALIDEIEPFQDYSKSLKLKPDHEKRPIWVTKNNLIILEAFSPIYKQAYDFLVAIAEPESRPEYIHCYRLTENSLYAAVAIFDTESIIKFLTRLCKTELPIEVANYIRECTYTFGKAKIVLKDNKFYIESKYQEILRELLKNPIIKNARVIENTITNNTTGSTGSSNTNENNTIKEINQDEFLITSTPIIDSRNITNLNLSLNDTELDYTKMGVEEMDEESEGEDELPPTGGDNTGSMKLSGSRSRTQTVSFMIAQQSVQVGTVVDMSYIVYIYSIDYTGIYTK